MQAVLLGLRPGGQGDWCARRDPKRLPSSHRRSAYHLRNFRHRSGRIQASCARTTSARTTFAKRSCSSARRRPRGLAAFRATTSTTASWSAGLVSAWWSSCGWFRCACAMGLTTLRSPDSARRALPHITAATVSIDGIVGHPSQVLTAKGGVGAVLQVHFPALSSAPPVLTLIKQ